MGRRTSVICASRACHHRAYADWQAQAQPSYLNSRSEALGKCRASEHFTWTCQQSDTPTMTTRNGMGQQLCRPKNMGPHNTLVVRTMGQEHPEGVEFRDRKDWSREHVCRDSTFLLSTYEAYRSASDFVGYTRQEDFVKISFWLSGKHSVILDGFGQHDHDCPEVFITAGPWDMVKVDVMKQESHLASVALCLQREFFPAQLGLAIEDLPRPLRVALLDPNAYAFDRFPLAPELALAARAILLAPFAVRRDPAYGKAKAVELMCLLVNNLVTADGQSKRRGERASVRVDRRIHEARDLLVRHYAEGMSIERISKEVGLNRMALTSGFKRLFGMSVHDCLQKVRMERAYELLQDDTYSISQIAGTIGFEHACNFSTAFRAYFGCTPQKMRVLRR
jgi:AraC-like DNA-binding protein